MPLFDFTCRGCGNQFELLVRGQIVPACPNCKSEDLEKHFSLPAIKADGTHSRALNAAKQRDKRLGDERVAAQAEYERNHD